LEVDNEVVAEINSASSRQDEDWVRLREQLRSA
jgi:hypothetical protein